MRITAGANAWRKVEGVMGDRRISRKHTGNVLSSCITVDRERSKRKVTGRKKIMEKETLVNSPLTTVIPTT